MSSKKKKKKVKVTIEKEARTSSRHVEFVGHASPRDDDEEDIAKETDSSVTQALRQAEQVEVEGGGTVYGNESGVDLVGQSQMLQRHSDQIAQLQLESKQHAQHFRELQTEIRILRDAAVGYLDIRHRFIETYRRDVRKIPVTQQPPRIRQGNLRAHSGDCITDAELYATGQRDDDQIYMLLYGLPWMKVRQLVDHQNQAAIRILDEYATWEADMSVELPESLKLAFGRFCDAIGDHPSKSLDYYEPNEPYTSHMAYVFQVQAWRQRRQREGRSQTSSETSN
ncbi:MAG: hypothetical protein ASARMPREDX12_003779 [Alectoria sarmentosa]|nr:MAG: hypothetical protein ASARMPREDX12_003779 [Alectoria sarmentosa]